MRADEAREFMHSRLGAEWEMRLWTAGAIVGPDATIREVTSAAERAVELICDVAEDWTLDTREHARTAWQSLWRDGA